MQLLQRQYIDRKIQQHLKELHLPQTKKKLTREELLEALKAKGAIWPEETPEGENILLSHCNLRTSYLFSGRKLEKRQMCVTIGLFAIFICTKEKPEALAEEIHRIDTQLIPQWAKDFNDLHPTKSPISPPMNSQHRWNLSASTQSSSTPCSTRSAGETREK